jgi:molecular chaperone DnaJ
MVMFIIDLIILISILQSNPFDLFEAFFGPSMGGFSGMDPAGFRTSRRSTVTKGEDIR